ncbi:hypothetical protein GTW51_04395 [Aurantimonas aggregata]|uniref:Uncharacterized protein n=1 Tax=Aurantimonas aggregata TaxID=2047720 RepID=A0A6L9MEC3_9HYPH|nr:hypothetical protein [Aurantimonas aggregata]NDV85938.1 hypothetical protein [Aurantimonas aggregata]
MRVPAPDIEKLVFTTLAGHLSDPQWLATIAGVADLTHLTKTIETGKRLALAIDKQQAGASKDTGPKAVAAFIQRIELGQNSVVLDINREALAAALGIAEPGRSADLKDDDEPIEIIVPMQLKRSGKQVRLILGEVTSKTRSPDGDLVRLVHDGHRWFDDLRSGRVATVAAIAKQDRQQVSHVSRNMSLAFLAPDITEMIVTGRQPVTLTPERLKASRPLPLDWNEQRAILLD